MTLQTGKFQLPTISIGYVLTMSGHVRTCPPQTQTYHVALISGGYIYAEKKWRFCLQESPNFTPYES